MADLSADARNNLPMSDFAIPETRSYPIPDKRHAANALARVEQHGTPEEKARVRKAVCKKFPQLPYCLAQGVSDALKKMPKE